MRPSIALLALAASLAGAAPTQNPDIIPDEYVVVFKKTVSRAEVEAHKASIASAIHASSDTPLGRTFSMDWLKGYSGKFDKKTLETIKADPKVAYVEENKIYRIVHTQDDDEWKQQFNATWGLGRVAHEKPKRTSYTWKTGGKPIDVYVLDTGIQTDHPEFVTDGKSRAEWLADFTTDPNHRDAHGHGTHCAGTIASNTYGVCKNCNVKAVRVLNANGGGTLEGVINGMNFVSDRYKDKGGDCVASMSLGGGYSKTLNDAADILGTYCVLAIAAGNSNADAKGFSPASANNCITVGATDENDAVAYFSNWGSLLEIFAPGVSVTSTWINNGINTISGTSMATPHVAGVAAYLMGLGDLNVKNAVQKLQEYALKGVVTGLTGPKQSPNFLLQSHVKELPDAPSSQPTDKQDPPPFDIPDWLRDILKEVCKNIQMDLCSIINP